MLLMFRFFGRHIDVFGRAVEQMLGWLLIFACVSCIILIIFFVGISIYNVRVDVQLPSGRFPLFDFLVLNVFSSSCSITISLFCKGKFCFTSRCWLDSTQCISPVAFLISTLDPAFSFVQCVGHVLGGFCIPEVSWDCDWSVSWNHKQEWICLILCRFCFNHITICEWEIFSEIRSDTHTGD